MPDKLNVLTWEKVTFMESCPVEKNEGYIFKIDGKPVDKYSGWMQPVYPGDILYSKFMENSESYDEEFDPVLACCTCGCSECDAIRAYVTIKDTVVNWQVFNANGSFRRDENLKERFFEEYNFDLNQYETTVKQLLEQAKKDLGVKENS